MTLDADPRLLARFDAAAGQWVIAEGDYRLILGRDAASTEATAVVALAARRFGS